MSSEGIKYNPESLTSSLSVLGEVIVYFAKMNRICSFLLVLALVCTSLCTDVQLHILSKAGLCEI